MFADYGLNLLRQSSAIVSSMDQRRKLAETIATNARRLMAIKARDYPTPNALATAINTPTKRVAPNSVTYILEPAKRPKGRTHSDTLPRLDTLAHVAEKLGCEVWELLHPDLPALRAKLDAYDRMIQTIDRDPDTPGAGHRPYLTRKPEKLVGP